MSIVMVSPGTFSVREHHAPVGALRQEEHLGTLPENEPVREHHAPVGALRRGDRDLVDGDELVREHHAPVGALRLELDVDTDLTNVESGSTTHL